jgi:3-phosphoshikimate 1-carboxyvinyltransferase
LGLNAEFFLEGRLSERPISPLSLQMVNHGCELSPQGSNPFFSRGKLQAGNYTLDAGVSSQFISGLLFALPILDGNSALRLSGEIESAPYVDLTAEMLQRFGIEIDFDGNVFRVRGNQTYKSPQKIRVEGDWSNAAFWLCAGAISENPITCTGLDLQSKQGDRAVLEILENFGASVERGSYSVTVCGGDLHATEIDARNIPDLVPILSVAAAAAKPNGNIGSTVIRNAARLRIKESDRLAAVADVLNTLGANVVERRDGLEIRGGTPLNGGIVSSWNDHRIAMSAAIAAALLPKGSENPVVITNAEAVNKSYPGFFEDLDKLKHSERHGY